MGCRKLSYNQGVRQLGKNHFFLGEYLEKSVTDEKKCIDYYPYGLTFDSYQSGSGTNPYKYNAGSELEEQTEWYHTAFRKYDAALGRFTAVDPLAEKFNSLSGYHFAYNNPVNFNDPTGLAPGGRPPVPSGAGQGGGPGTNQRFLNTLLGKVNGLNRMGWNLGTGFNADGSFYDPFAGQREDRQAGIDAAENNDAGGLNAYAAKYGESYRLVNNQTPHTVSIEGYGTYNSVQDNWVLEKAQNGGSTSAGIMAGTLALSGGLLADDVTVVGIADDVAIPFILVGGTIVAGAVYAYQKYWTSRGEGKPQPPVSYSKSDVSNRVPNGGGGNFWMKVFGGGATAANLIYLNQYLLDTGSAIGTGLDTIQRNANNLLNDISSQSSQFYNDFNRSIKNGTWYPGR